MAGKQKKGSSGGIFSSFFRMFKSKSSSSSRTRINNEDDYFRDDYVKAYKVWPSDEDRGRWVAEPGIDWKVPHYLESTTENWKNAADAN